MATAKVQKIPQKKVTAEHIIALFCYNFQQYTYSQARKIPYRRVMQMLSVAKKEHARKMSDMLSVVSSAQNKSQTKKLFDKFSAIMNE